MDLPFHSNNYGIYIRDTIPYSVYISHESIELLLVELKLKRGHLFCGVFYRSPLSKSSVLTVLESTLKAISPNRLTSLTLLGDFNIDQRNPDHPLQPHLHSIQDKLNLRQVVSEPTRSTISTDTLLDLAFLSDPSMLSSCTTETPWMVPTIIRCALIYSCLHLARRRLVGEFGCTSRLTLKVQITCYCAHLQISFRTMLTISGLNGAISSSQP